MCGSRKYPYHPPPNKGALQNPRGSGMLKAKTFKGNCEPIEEFPEGWGFKPKKPSVSKAKIFKGNYKSQQEFPERWGSSN